LFQFRRIGGIVTENDQIKARSKEGELMGFVTKNQNRSKGRNAEKEDEEEREWREERRLLISRRERNEGRSCSWLLCSFPRKDGSPVHFAAAFAVIIGQKKE
jgi:hypothetical protein